MPYAATTYESVLKIRVKVKKDAMGTEDYTLIAEGEMPIGIDEVFHPDMRGKSILSMEKVRTGGPMNVIEQIHFVPFVRYNDLETQLEVANNKISDLKNKVKSLQGEFFLPE